ncbi:MAG: FG-GAP-like repeat-containing protein [Isosphaeraceae bacterium]
MKPPPCESEAVVSPGDTSRALRLAAQRGNNTGRRWLGIIGLTAILAMLGWVGWWAYWARRFESEIPRVRQLMNSERFREAKQSLLRLPSPWARQPEVVYRLGLCERALGNIQAALAAWSRVDLRSIWSVQAGLAKAGVLVADLGRFSDAETLLESLMRDPGAARDEVRHTLSELYFWEGRRGAMRRLLERDYRLVADPVLELRNHWRIDNAVTLLEKVRWEVDQASRLAPDDDRVWLTQASLATQTGRFAEALGWLDRCVERRPRDPAVWRARLDWARAAGNLAELRRAVAFVPAAELTECERLELRGWLASRIGNAPAERDALERLVAIVHDPAAFERLAVLAWDTGQHERARALRRRKAELDAAKNRYRLLMEESIGPELFTELAGLAGSLGRQFEAQGWWSLRARSAPGDQLASQAVARFAHQPEPASVGAQVTLAELLSELDPELKTASTRPQAPQPPPGGTLPRFADRAESAGLRFVFDNGRSRLSQIPETMAGGVGLFDYDGDGWLDVYVVQGGVFPPRPDHPNTGDRLFRNRGDGTFEDARDRSGISRMKRGFGLGVTVGDIDNDGHPDLFITRWRAYALLRNRGDGTFEDVTDRAGLGGERDWPSSAAFADLDNDGDLDLYVCHYLVWDANHPTLCPRKRRAAANERVDPEQQYTYCNPRSFAALSDHLFRNDGGRFVDVTKEAGIVDPNGRGLGVVAADLDEDGRVDLFVANDTTANYLWHNLGGLKFEEAGVASGIACNADGAFQAGMGTACGDLDGDGLPDLLVTNFYGESTTFFQNLGSGAFTDQTVAIGLAAPSRFLLGFGIALLDADNDGRLDLATANGHVNDDRPNYPYQMPASLFLGGKGGRLTDVTAAAGEPWTVPRVARGLAVGDLDNDGRIDVVLLPELSPLGYFHNQTKAGHAVAFELEGTRSNRDAIGAVVTLTAAGRRRRAWRYGGGSYQSASGPRIDFGLGDDRIDQVEVGWPSGRVDRYGPVEADRCYRLREGASQPVLLRSFPGR